MESPKISNNGIQDIIDWVNMGDCVMICAKGGHSQIYHNCSENSDQFRTVYVDVYEREWEYLTKSEVCQSCTCDIKKGVKGFKNPNSHYIVLGYYSF
jgi:hypothetical protein